MPEVVGQMRSDELDARIREILHDEVATLFQAQLSEMFGSIKSAMVEYFDERYVAIAETAIATTTTTVRAAEGGASWAFRYRDFDNTNPTLLMGYRTRLEP